MRYTFLLAILGALVSHLAYRLGGLWNLLHWFSFSCFALAIGHAGLGHRVFGKHRDGRIPVWSKFAHLPYMLFSGALWYVTCLLSRENAIDKISDDIILGRRLRPSEVPEGIINYVDLTAEMEDAVEIREFPNYICLPILDASVPSPDALRSTISSLSPGVTYVHCAQGHGRTGLFVLSLLAESRSITSFDDGMAKIKSARPGIAFNKAQEQFLRSYIATRLNSR